MTARTWHKGKPPHIGWWEASIDRDKDCWRWWDGEHWCCLAHPEMSVVQAGKCAKIRPGWTVDDMEWTDYWPANARVPRIDPNGGQHD